MLPLPPFPQYANKLNYQLLNPFVVLFPPHGGRRGGMPAAGK